jgi:PAT family beta-lactamase induction signal transducer AmpG
MLGVAQFGTTVTGDSTLNLSDNPRLRILTLCALYVAQGIPWGFVTVTLVAFLGSEGVDMTSIGDLTAMATLPWAFKFFWGPIIDRFGIASMGRRRPWIVVAQALMTLTILAMVLVEDLTASVKALVWILFLHNVFASLQDVAVDALAVDLLEEDERGRVNGFMWASKYLGMLIGGAGMGTVMGAFGIRSALIVQGVMLAGIMMFPLWLRERGHERLLPWSKGLATAVVEETRGSTRVLFAHLRRAFSTRTARVGVLYAVVCQTATAGGATFAMVLLTSEAGWTAEEVSHLTGGWGVLAGVLAAVIGGFLVDRVGVRKMMVVGIWMVGLNYAIFGLGGEAFWVNRTYVFISLIVVTLFNTLTQVGSFALYMGVSLPVVAATQFTAYMTLINVSMTWGQKATGWVEGTLGYSNGLLLVGVFHAATSVFLLWVDPRDTKRLLRDEEGSPEASTGPALPPDAVVLDV